MNVTECYQRSILWYIVEWLSESVSYPLKLFVGSVSEISD